MAVWESPTYKLPIARDLTKISSMVTSHVLGPTISPYLKPDEATTGLTPEMTWDDLSGELLWRPYQDAEIMYEFFKENFMIEGRYIVGTSAVYHLIKSAFDGKFEVHDAYDWNHVDTVMKEFNYAIANTTKLNPKIYEAKSSARDESLMLASRRLENFSEAMKHSRLSFNNDWATPTMQDQRKFFGDGSREYYGAVIGQTLFLRGASEKTNQVLVLSREHLDFVVGCSMRLANTLHYYAKIFANDGIKADEILKFISFQITVAAAARDANSYKVARAFHKARTLFQMKILNSVLDDAYRGELSDYYADGLDQILSLQRLRLFYTKFTKAELIEIHHIYKWMPSPDYDTTAVFAEVKSYHMNPRTSGMDQVADLESRETYELIQKERVYNLYTAVKRMTGSYPDGTPTRSGKLSYPDLDLYPTEGVLEYTQFGKNIAPQIKDKSTVQNTLEKEKSGQGKKSDQSFLLWYMANGNDVDTEKILSNLHNTPILEENYSRVAYKAESHKPNSRLFYMAPPITRIMQGEFEANMSRVAEHYPGSLMGKSVAERAKITHSIMDIHQVLPNIPEDAICTQYIVTFDLTKFSPKSNYAQLAEYYKFWASVYGIPNIEYLAEIGCKGKILHTTDDIIMEYTNIGPDLEGFRGKMNTMFHADMLGTACRLARSRGYIVGKSNLAVFIDDGAVKIAAVGTGLQALDNCRNFLGVMQEVYASAGQDCNPAKTVASISGGEILAEFHINGVHVPVGVKAAQRLYPTWDNLASTLPEEMDSLYASAQGSVKDGGDWITIYTMYVESCVKLIYRWTRKQFTATQIEALIVKLITPKSLGGFGISTIQALVSTTAVNAFTEGVAMMNCVGRHRVKYRRRIELAIPCKVLIRDPLAVLRDPTRVRGDKPVMIENRVMMSVFNYLQEYGTEFSTFIAAYKDKDLIKHATSLAASLLASRAVSIPLLQRAWKSTPLAFVETVVGKFKRSSTIIALLKSHKVKSIRDANREDVMGVLRSA